MVNTIFFVNSCFIELDYFFFVRHHSFAFCEPSLYLFLSLSLSSKHGMMESIELFSSADVVVAPHGAALGFLAFMRPFTACVEIG